MNLVLAERDGHLGEKLPEALIRVPKTQVALLPGPRSHAQAASLVELWGPLALEFRGLEATGQDIIVDVGRLGMASSPAALIAASDLALLVTRSDLPALSAARQWAAEWAQASADGVGPTSAGVVLVGERRPYSAREVSKVLAGSVLGVVAWDSMSAQVLSLGDKPGGRSWARRDRMMGSLRALASVLETRVRGEQLVVASGDLR